MKILLYLLLSCLAIPVFSDEIVVIKANRVDTVTSGIIENGIIIIRDGKISAIGANLEIPANASIIDAGNKTIFPGLINPVSRMGLSAAFGGEPQSNPHYRIADELSPYRDTYKRILRSGFTALGLIPGSSGITGQGAVVYPIGETVEEEIIAEAGFLMISFQANDKAKKVIRDALELAKQQTGSIDPRVIPLVKALQGEIPTFVMCSWPAEYLHLSNLLKPYDKMRLVFIAGSSETFRVAEKLAEKRVIYPVRIDFEYNTRNRVNVPKIFTDAKARLAFQPINDSIEAHEDFLREVAQLVQYGLDKEIAKKAITIHPAEMLGLDYRMGSLETGKDANLLILTGDPLDAGTKIQQVMINGKVVYQAP